MTPNEQIAYAVGITPLGWILIPLGVALFFLAPRGLYGLMIFFIPFSATAIVNAGSDISAFGLQATMFFGALWILRKALNTVVSGYLRLPRRQAWSTVLQLAFVSIALLSLSMPVIINGGLVLDPVLSITSAATPLTLDTYHVTQFLYLIYGMVLAILIAAHNSQPGKLENSLKFYVLSGVFVSFWGWLQFLSYQLDIPYPSGIFNNSAHPAAQGFEQTLTDINLTRIASVAVEPSIFAQFLLTVIPIVLFSVIGRRAILSPAMDRLALIVMVSVLLLSTSSTGYVGLLFMAVASTVYIYFMGILRLQHLIVGFTVMFAGIIIYLAVPIVSIVSEELVLSKLESYSGQERLAAATKAWDYFRDYPVLGIGWGSIGTKDLITHLLATTGIVGLASFTAMILYALGRLEATRRLAQATINAPTSLWAASITVSLLTLLFTSVTSGFPFPFSHFWFILGIAMGVPSARPYATMMIKKQALAKTVP